MSFVTCTSILYPLLTLHTTNFTTQCTHALRCTTGLSFRKIPIKNPVQPADLCLSFPQIFLISFSHAGGPHYSLRSLHLYHLYILALSEHFQFTTSPQLAHKRWSQAWRLGGFAANFSPPRATCVYHIRPPFCPLPLIVSLRICEPNRLVVKMCTLPGRTF